MGHNPQQIPPGKAKKTTTTSTTATKTTQWTSTDSSTRSTASTSPSASEGTTTSTPPPITDGITTTANTTHLTSVGSSTQSSSSISPTFNEGTTTSTPLPTTEEITTATKTTQLTSTDGPTPWINSISSTSSEGTQPAITPNRSFLETSTKYNNTETMISIASLKHSDSNQDAVIGGVIGGLLVLIIAVTGVIAVLYLRKRRRTKKPKTVLNGDTGNHSVAYRQNDDYEESVSSFDEVAQATEKNNKGFLTKNDENANYFVLEADFSDGKVKSGEEGKNSTLYSLARYSTEGTDEGCFTENQENAVSNNYFVLENEYDTEQSTGVSDPSKHYDPYLLSTAANDADLSQNNYSEIDEHDGRTFVSGRNDVRVEQDAYGYSHMADIKRNADHRDSTYDHALHCDEMDNYGYAKAHVVADSAHPNCTILRDATDTADSEYSAIEDSNESEYNTLTNI